MGFAETMIYAADTLEALAHDRYAQAGALALVLLAAVSFALGELGARLRGGLMKLGIFGLIGACGALAVVAVKGVPAPETAQAPAAPPAEKRVEAWIARQQQHAEAARGRDRRERPPMEARAVEAARQRLLERAEARRAIEEARAEIRRTPEAERTPEQRRRDAGLDVRLAELDRFEGRIAAALRRYRAAQAVFARLADPDARRAGVETALHTASALEERSDAEAARAAYRSAIDDQRGLVELPERERRGGLAAALVRYAKFEIGRREERPARAALDEAAGHYAFLRAQRGMFAVIKARAELAIALGDGAAARGEIAALRALLAQPVLAALAPDVDAAEARLMLAESRAAEAAALFARAAEALRRAAAERRAFDRETQIKLSAALLGLAEAGFAARDTAAARTHAGEAIAIRRALAEPRPIVEALVRLAMWEAAAGDAAAAERALASGLEARRALAEIHSGSEAEGAMRLLCAGALRGREICRLVPDADATAAGP